MDRKLIGIAILCGGGDPRRRGRRARRQTPVNASSRKQATATFQQLAKAKAAGYALELKTTPANGAKACIADAAGGMVTPHGEHGSPSTARSRSRSPEALVYEPRGGKLQLVALEYVVDRKAWHDAGQHQAAEALRPDSSRSTTKNPFGLKPFYALHAWVWNKNPAGWLQPWNPVLVPVVGGRP